MPTLPRYDGCVFDNVPRAVPGAQVYVYAQPVSFTQANWSPLASGLATIYNDNAGAHPVSNPLQASNSDPTFDGNGNYFFYAASGLYTLVLYGGTLNGPTFLPDQILGVGAVGVTLQTNSTPNSTQVLLNLFAGAGVSLVESAGKVTITSTGSGITFKHNHVNNSVQNLLDLTAGTGISIAETAGVVTITNTGTVLILEVNGTPNGSQDLLNLVAGPSVTITDNGIGSITINTPVGVSGSPPAGYGEIQYAGAGAFAGSPNLAWNPSTNVLEVNGIISLTGLLDLGTVLFDNLITLSPTVGSVIYCVDALGPQDASVSPPVTVTWGEIAVGGGTGSMLVYDGYNWRVH